MIKIRTISVCYAIDHPDTLIQFIPQDGLRRLNDITNRIMSKLYKNRSGHAIGLIADRYGNIKYFDPCIGEYLFNDSEAAKINISRLLAYKYGSLSSFSMLDVNAGRHCTNFSDVLNEKNYQGTKQDLTPPLLPSSLYEGLFFMPLNSLAVLINNLRRSRKQYKTEIKAENKRKSTLSCK